MSIPYVFRKPRLPVIIVVDDRVFSAISTAAIQKLLKRELKPDAERFKVMTGEVEAIIPSISQSPTKQALITNSELLIS